MEDEGIKAIRMHGGIEQAERTNALQEVFRKGDAAAMITTTGVARTGLNIPEVWRVLFYDRDWSACCERQAKARVLRPQQKKQVTVEYFHLPGSVDEYQAQMVAFKSDAADSGLDWASPTLDGTQFMHIDTLIGRFVSATNKLKESPLLVAS